MNVNITAYLIFIACGAVLCAAWFFLDDRKENPGKNSALLAVLVLVLGAALGLACARLVWVLCTLNYHHPLFGLSYDELSYYGGVAGVLLAVFLAAKLAGRNVRETLNTFAPMGALLAALFRFAEYFLGEFGVGMWMDQGLFFPLTIENVISEDYSEFFPAVFMLEGTFSLVAAAIALFRRYEKYRWLRTLFYLCLPQILCESLRSTSIAWLFVRAEMLFCYLLCEGVLIWYAFRAGRKQLKSWVPAIVGLVACGIVITAQFAIDGKITVGNSAIPQWISYAVEIAALAAVAVAEHKGYRAIKNS